MNAKPLKPAKARTLMQKRTLMGYMFLTPTLIIVLCFIVYPVLTTLYNSFFSIHIQTMQRGARFIGLQNYQNLLKDRLFWVTLRFTAIFVVAAVSLETCFAMMCGLIMKREFKGQGFIRACILIPWTIPNIVSGLMWRFMYSEGNGVVNLLLKQLGIISQSIPWLTNTTWATVALIIADVWKNTPYMALLILAGLQTISNDVYEAAEIDGVNPIQRLFYITLPLVKPVLSVAVLFRVIQALRVYDLVQTLTAGGPASTTQSLTMYTVQKFFGFGNIGYGSAGAMATFVLAMGVALLFTGALKTKMEGVKK